MKLTEQELTNILDKHGKWLRNEPDGQRANLQYADLSYANLQLADLQNAYLKYANLQYANLQYANLQNADLQNAYLKYANLQYANLQYAYLQGADLQDANLEGADLEDVKNDYFSRLNLAKDEVVGLYKALIEGKINGSVYEGECACFCGTIANLRKENYKQLTINLRPDSSCPTERWFLGIRKGDTAENSPISNITSEWTKEFADQNGIKLPTMKKVWE